MASLPDFDPTWMIMYELAEQGITDARGHVIKVLLYNKTRSERLKKAGVLPTDTGKVCLYPFRG